MLKAIETSYKGYRFRSRLEARWAVFFSTLGARWEYEAQGYDLNGVGLYLPDFQLFNDLWVEIKGPTPTPQEIARGAALAVAANGAVLIVSGTPGDESTLWCCPNGEVRPTPHLNMETAWCRIFNICKPNCDVRSICRPYFRAVQAARSARFEHGERPL